MIPSKFSENIGHDLIQHSRREPWIVNGNLYAPFLLFSILNMERNLVNSDEYLHYKREAQILLRFSDN